MDTSAHWRTPEDTKRTVRCDECHVPHHCPKIEDTADLDTPRTRLPTGRVGEPGSDDYFFYLKRPYLGKVISLSAATFGITIAAVLLCVLPVFYVMVPVALMNVIFAFNPDLSTSEIIKAGFNLGNKKWLLTFGLIIISSLLAGIVGMLMCCIGIYVTSSFSYLPAYFIYKDSVGFDEKEDNETYGMSYE